MTHSNLVLADCPPNMEENIMKQSYKITALYCRLSHNDDQQQFHRQSKSIFDEVCKGKRLSEHRVFRG